MILDLQMVMHEPWKASAQEVYLLRTTDGSVPRGLDPNMSRTHDMIPHARGQSAERDKGVAGDVEHIAII